MFVSTDNYPFFREDACHSHNKTNRFKLENFNQQVCKSQESLPIFPLPKERKKILKKKFNTDKKVDKKEKLQTSVNFLDSINESKSILPKTQYLSKLNNENLSTLIHYKKLESVKKTNPIFHLPPLVTKPIDPETTFLTFGELDEINEKLLLHQQIKGSSIDKIYEKNKLNMELTYNKTQYGKLKTIYNNEEKSSYKILIENISKNKLKELRTPKIKTYSSLALLSNGNNNSNFFTEVQLPEPEKEQLERKKEIKIKKGINSYDNIHFESSIYFYSYEQNGWRPEIRELCTMILLDKKIYIYSGIGRNIMDDIVVADLGTLSWEKITQGGDAPSYGRYGHSAVLYNRKMFIFGGEKKFNSHLKQHECLNDIRYFSLDTFNWKYIRTIGDIVDARRNHAATIAGRFMIINGGINPKDQYLNDFWSFDFMINKWASIPVKGANKNGIAFHTSCSVFQPERLKIVLFKALEPLDENLKKIQYEGIYYFGGKNGVFFSNELTILLIDQNPMQLIKPEIIGKPPLPRYGHTMVYNELQNILIIYGGRNDYENCFFGDIHILKLNVLCWIGVKVNGIPKAPRASHCACVFNTKLVVFGGLNLNGLTNSDIIMVELDNSQVKKFVSHENNLKPMIQIIEEPVKNEEKEKKSPKHGEESKTKTQMLYFEEEEKQKMKKQKMEILMETLKFQNFRSFLPLPNYKFGNKGIIDNSNTLLSPLSSATKKSRNHKGSFLKK